MNRLGLERPCESVLSLRVIVSAYGEQRCKQSQGPDCQGYI